MRITFLGTGSAMPTGERFQTGILLEAGDDPLLIDCGSGVLHGLERTQVGYEGVDTVLVTHHHLDHVSDLLPLLKARWLAGAESLTVLGPPGTPALLEDLLEVHDYLQDRLELTLRTVESGGPFEVAGFRAEAIETRHGVQCLAYRLTPDGDGVDNRATAPPTFGFSGDSGAFPELIEFFDGTAVFAHDCSFPDGIDVSNHPTPSELGAALAAADAELGRVYLTHLYPHTEGRHEGMLESIGDRYDGEVRIARDGLSIAIE